MKVSNIKCKLKHPISIMVRCENYEHEFSVSKDMKKKKITMMKGERRWHKGRWRCIYVKH
jgi:hypothetical protein